MAEGLLKWHTEIEIAALDYQIQQLLRTLTQLTLHDETNGMCQEKLKKKHEEIMELIDSSVDFWMWREMYEELKTLYPKYFKRQEDEEYLDF